jgi:hypothetical protein
LFVEALPVVAVVNWQSGSAKVQKVAQGIEKQ